MDPAAQLQAILEIFSRLGVEVREEHLGGAGGNLCRIRERQVFFLDLDADVGTRAERCAAALAEIPELASIYVPPELRERIERARIVGG